MCLELGGAAAHVEGDKNYIIILAVIYKHLRTYSSEGRRPLLSMHAC